MAEVQAEQQLDGRGGLPSIVVLVVAANRPSWAAGGATAVNAGANGAGKRR